MAMFGLLAAAAAVALSQERQPGRLAGDPHCSEMLAELQGLGGQIIELDQELAGKIEQMGRATGEERLDAMQAAIEEMATQRRAMTEKIKVSHQLLVYHLLGHLMVEPPEQGRASLRSCVLMDYMRRSAAPGGPRPASDGPLDH
jgi:hypothetical protein